METPFVSPTARPVDHRSCSALTSVPGRAFVRLGVVEPSCTPSDAGGLLGPPPPPVRCSAGSSQLTRHSGSPRQKSAIRSSLTCSASRSAAFSLKNVASRCRMTSKIRFRSWRIYSSFGVSSSPTVPKGQPAAGPAGASRSGGWGIPNPLALSERQRAVRRASFSTIVDVCSVVRPGRASTTRGGSRRASGLTG